MCGRGEQAEAARWWSPAGAKETTGSRTRSSCRCGRRGNRGYAAVEVAVTVSGRTRCEELVESLTFPQPWDLNDFIAMLARRRGKPIVLKEGSLGLGHPCGMLVCAVEADYVYCSGGLAALHAHHSVLHEIGHLLLEHGTAEAEGAELPRVAGHDALHALLPDLPPELIARILRRGSYVSEQERDAELFASLAMARVTSPRRRYGGIHGNGQDPLVRLDSAFGMPEQRRPARAG